MQNKETTEFEERECAMDSLFSLSSPPPFFPSLCPLRDKNGFFFNEELAVERAGGIYGFDLFLQVLALEILGNFLCKVCTTVVVLPNYPWKNTACEHNIFFCDIRSHYKIYASLL